MRLDGKVSKVAVCPICNKFTLACHIDYLDKKTEKEFTEMTNNGFDVKLETVDITRSREYSEYEKCLSHIKNHNK